jgi:hypothetical protein
MLRAVPVKRKRPACGTARSKDLGPSRLRAPMHSVNGGVADSLGEAKAAFPAAWRS